MHQADAGAGETGKEMIVDNPNPAAGGNGGLLPRCVCNWKNCRIYQKTLLKHPVFGGVIKLKFSKMDRKSMALKAAVDRTLKVDPEKQDNWNTDPPSSVEDPTCRYYVAKHHFTENLMKQYNSDRRAWNWNEPLPMTRASTFLWSLERQDVYLSEDEEEHGDSDFPPPTRYVQAPNVKKEHVRDLVKRVKEAQRSNTQTQSTESSNGKAQRNSTHTQSTVSTSVTGAENGQHGEGDGDPNALTQENRALQDELDHTKLELIKLTSLVNKLKDHIDLKDSTDSKKKPKSKKKKHGHDSISDEDESSSEEDDDGEESSGRRQDSEGDETVSTFNNRTTNSNGRSSNHSRPGSRQSSSAARKNSVHSRRNSVRRISVHSRSRHSRRDSVHSKRSMRGMDDTASVVSAGGKSLQSISPSIKSLPREIELMDDEEDTTQGKDDYSFFDGSYRKEQEDDKSVGSRSAASRASRRSIVSSTRGRGRNQRRPTQPSSGGPPLPRPSNNRSSAVPREIDLSGDELEEETYANSSTDTLFVENKQIVDPYGEKGVYTGALSRSTKMPNGKGRLAYEKEGRWYEGDWIHGRWTGYGRLSNGDGDFYEGGLKNDHKHGSGVMRFADGRVFDGEYIRGQMIEGKMTYQDGSVYGGSWVDGMRHGRGKCIFVDGSEYEGEFREGNFHGRGEMTWNDGGWYVGEWCDGEMHGRGKEVRPDTTVRHDGEWSRGQPIRSANESRRRRPQSGGDAN